MENTAEIAPDEQATENTESSWMASQSPEVQDYISKLRKENAGYRVSKKEIETNYQKALEKAAELDKFKEEQAQANGEFEKLYKQEKDRADSLEGLSERVKAYEEQFAKQFDEVKGNLTEAQLELIEASNMSIEKKLEWANRLQAESPANVNSPSSERPGGSMRGNDTIIEQYNNGDLEAKATILYETKKSNPKLYDTLLRL